MPRRKQSHPQPVKCEGVKGQGSGAAEGGGGGGVSGVGSGRGEGGLLRDGVGDLDSSFP